jgi:PKD repeat protein
MNKPGVFFLILFFPMLLQAQEPDHCGTMYADSLRRLAHPELGDQLHFERWLKEKTREMQQNPQVRDEIVTIPVIVHVIHDNEPVGVGRNISQAQVESQIEVLNEDYRRKFGTPGYNNHPDGADIEIEFCLASIDTSGNALSEPGIDRVDKNDFPNWPNFPFSVNQVETFVQPFTIWNPEDYLNIWVVDLSGNNLGFAQLPQTDSLPGLASAGSASNDGVTINYTNFGRVGNLAAPYDGGRTTTHEIGHYFGLYHTWGDGDCNDDDYCEDTPDANTSHFGCPTGVATCGSNDMIENYMDYTDDACMNVFTNCQKLRMRTVLLYAPRRKTLLNSNACTALVPPVAQFGANFTTACENSYIKFLDNSPNATSWSWSFPGGIPASSTAETPSVQYQSAGTYDIKLVVSNQYGTDSITLNDYLTITTSALTTFYEETFESGLSAWTTENPDNSITWEVNQVGGSQSGSFAVGINLYGYSAVGERDGLVSPVIDLASRSSVRLNFEHAYRPFSSSEHDSLLVFASVDGGTTWPYKLYAGAENGNGNFATNEEYTSNFTPDTGEDWCFSSGGYASCVELDLKEFDGEANFRLKFESVNDYGNSLWLDNIRLSGTCQPIMDLERDLQAREDFLLFPNPSEGILSLRLKGQPGEEVQLTMRNLLGQLVWEQSIRLSMAEEERQFDWQHLPKGPYVFQFQNGDRIGFQKIVLK